MKYHQKISKFVAASLTALLLAACSPEPSSTAPASSSAAFQGIDITGNSQFSTQFSLPDLSEQSINLQSFMQKSQKPSLVIFGYTACPDYCPNTLSKILEVKKQLQAKNIDVKEKLNIFFITIDGKRDTPAVLKKYLAAFDEQIIGLSASGENLNILKKNFKIAVEDQGNLINHTTGLYIIDKDGMPRVYLPYNLTAEQIANDIKKLLN